MADEAAAATPTSPGDSGDHPPSISQDMKKEIIQGTHLKPTTTKEPISEKDIMRSEIVVKEVVNFDKENLKHVETQEKTVLPDKDAIAAEVKHHQFKSDIEQFEKKELKPTETVEKDTKPTAEDIAKEKNEATEEK